MSFSKIANSIGASVTLQLNAKAAGMRAAGDPVIHLGGGEPKSKAPEAAILSGQELLSTGEIRYTPASGTPALKDAIIDYTRRFYGREVDRGNVLASAGAKQAIMVALTALVDPGDEVLYPVPYWVSYPEMARLAGGVPVSVRAADGGFQPTLAEMSAAITPRTKVIMLNSPNNPSGAVYADDFIRGMVTMCEERGISLFMDDIYRQLVFDGHVPVNCYDCTDRKVDESRVVVFNGVSKEYAMTGFRIGWAVGPRDLIKVMANIQSHETGGPCSISQVSAAAAVSGPQDSVHNLRETLEMNRNEMVRLLNEIPGLKVNVPQGTFYSFCDFSAFDPDSTRLAAHLLDKVQVVTVPGIEFGLDGHLRMSYCGSLEDVREGVRRIKWLLDKEGGPTLEASGRTFTR
jgi:aspartate aminotransferase